MRPQDTSGRTPALCARVHPPFSHTTPSPPPPATQYCVNDVNQNVTLGLSATQPLTFIGSYLLCATTPYLRMTLCPGCTSASPHSLTPHTHLPTTSSWACLGGRCQEELCSTLDAILCSEGLGYTISQVLIGFPVGVLTFCSPQRRRPINWAQDIV